MAESLDLNKRDPQNLNSLVQVEYDDIIGEPKGTHSCDFVWTNAHQCFSCSKNYSYKILTFCCGICCGKNIL